MKTDLTIARIIKVNHAGEWGAIRIYRAQIFFSKFLYPDLVPFLTDTLGHEIEHCRLFRNAMKSRNTRPCRIMSLWGNGGYVLGGLTALLGRNGIWVCTSAVEGAVHRHLDDQLFYLRDLDNDLHSLISSIQEEELSHLNHANENLPPKSFGWTALSKLISFSTDVVIWLSTWGSSTQMARSLRKAQNG